jgi:hypothetical protein
MFSVFLDGKFSKNSAKVHDTIISKLVIEQIMENPMLHMVSTLMEEVRDAHVLALIAVYE